MKRILILSNLQRDFMPDGALKISGANRIIPIINEILPKFEQVVVVRDWHPPNHISFAKTHHEKPRKTIQIGEVQQFLWPVHCVQGTPGAELVKELNQTKIEAVFNKGTDPSMDCYSVFFDACRRHSIGFIEYLNRRHSIGLVEYLNNSDFDNLYFAGLATEYAILNSVLDATDLGFNASVVSDACCPIASEEEGQKALERIKELGAQIYLSKEL